jgi:hypothetical protein
MLITHHATPVQIFINEQKSRGDLPFTHIAGIFAQGYIIPYKFSFHSSSRGNKCSCTLMATGWQQFCGDIVNIFGHEDQKFQWSRAYFYYSSDSAQKEVIWSYGITRVGCVHKVFDFKEVVSWSAKKYIPSQRIIPLCNHSSFSLSPQVFRKMLKLSKPTLTFRGQHCKQFLEEHENELDILVKFLEDPTIVPEDITKLQISSFINPFQELLGCLQE